MTTLYRLSEEILLILSGGQIQAATNTSISELKISICQVANQLLKVESFPSATNMGEYIPNGASLGWYEGISGFTWNGKSKFTLPIKPIKLLRNSGVYAVYPKYTINGNYELDKEWIPIQMGQAGLLKSQRLLSDLLGQVGYENYGLDIITNTDVVSLFPDIKIAMRLVILDFSQYGDYDPLPILPEHELQIKKEVLSIYSNVQVADYVVDVTSKSQMNTPIKQQQQTPSR